MGGRASQTPTPIGERYPINAARNKVMLINLSNMESKFQGTNELGFSAQCPYTDRVRVTKTLYRYKIKKSVGIQHTLVLRYTEVHLLHKGQVGGRINKQTYIPG